MRSKLAGLLAKVSRMNTEAPNGPANPVFKRMKYTDIARVGMLSEHPAVQRACDRVLATQRDAVFCKNGTWYCLTLADPI